MKKNLLVFILSVFIGINVFAQGVTLSSPSDGAQLSGVSATLYWNTISGSTKYDWRCDTTPNFNSSAFQSGYVTSSYSYASVSNLHYGATYYWQVRARNASDTTPWSPMWHFTTASGPVALSSPVSGNTISGVSTTLYWNQITGSTKYDYQCDLTSNFNSQYLQSGYVTSSYNYQSVSNLKYGTTYYWRVRARNAADTTAWSAVWKFATAAPNVTLSYPTDGTQLSGVSTTLYWNSITGSTKYDWRCDTVATFNSGALQTGYVTSSYDYASVSNLYYGTTYYWQVRARNANDTTPWSPMWKFTTAAGPVILDYPTDGATINGVSTTLYWNAITGSTKYDWQCDVTPTFNSSSLQTGYVTSSYDYASVSNLRYGTTYYWRVRARNSADTTAWSEVRTFTTIQPVLTLDYPTDGTQLSGVSTTLYWNSISGSTRYDWRCDTVPTFNSNALQTNYVTSSYDYVSVSNLYYGTTYYWQVRARNANDTTNWSTIWHFTTGDGPVVLNYPTDGTQLNGVSTTIYWNQITGSTRYDWQCDTTPNFNSPLLQGNYVTSSYDYASVTGLRYGTTYYWRVRARNAVDTTEWSAPWKFSTIMQNLTLSYPTDGTQLSGVSTTLYWNSISGSTRYDWRCDTVPTFNSNALQNGYVTSSYDYASVSNLYYGKTYYWQVRARNANDTTDWSETWRFTTADGPVVHSYPADGTIISGVSATLYWNQISGSTRYDWQCDTTPNFNSAFLQNGYVTSSYDYVSVSNLRYGTSYFWRVRARNAVDTTEWSAPWKFCTVLEDLTLSYPTDGTQLSGVSTTLYWNSISGSTRYDWRCDTVPTFNSNALQTGYVTSSYDYVSVSNLYYGTTYYWQVRARNANDTTDWSETWRFTTADGPVVHSYPSDGTIISGVSATLYWNQISGSTRYDWQCDTTPNFNSAFLQNGYVTSSYDYVSVSNLRYGTSYFWRVRARNAVDTTEWSAPWKFCTVLEDLTLSYPADGTQLSGVSTTLYWNSISGSTRYDWRCDTVPTFNSNALQTGYVTSSYDYVSVSDLYYGTTYYWQVRARNANDTTDWSETWRFTTADGPVVLSSPSNGTTLHAVSATLYWNQISGSTKYDWQCDTTLNFNSVLLQSGYVTSSYNYVSVSNLHFCSTYYWRVRARNAVDTTEWSTVWSFVTTDYLATAPTLISPADQSTNIPASGQTFVWSSVADATGYEMQYSTSSSFATYSSVNINNTNTVVNNFAPNTTYYWRVRAYNINGASPWSVVWSFTTEQCYCTSSFDVTDCDSYTWNNQTYTQSGVYTQHFTTVLGCDSTVTLNLTIHHSENVTENLSICEGDLPYTYNDTVFEVGTPQFSTHTFLFSTQNGCDSTVTLNLTIHPDFENDEYITISQNDLPYTYNDTVFEVGTPQISTHTFLFSTQNGCDSTITLHLTIATDIAEQASDAIRCYPNPTSDWLIVSGLTIRDELMLVDASGRIVWSVLAQKETEILHMEHLSKGVYFLEITNSQKRLTKKVIRN